MMHRYDELAGLGLVAALCLAALSAGAASNLVVNGSFDFPGDSLHGWKCRYDPEQDKNAGWYTNSDANVAVVEREGPQKKVLSLWGDYAILQAPGQGTKVDSDPIPVKPGGKFRFSARARSTGPDCRIMLEGYKWVPGVKPHEQPKLNELRRCYRFCQLCFGKNVAGAFGGVGRDWERASVTAPERTGSKLQQEILNEVQFLVVHIMAIGGSEGNLYVDDVRVERIQ